MMSPSNVALGDCLFVFNVLHHSLQAITPVIITPMIDITKMPYMGT